MLYDPRVYIGTAAAASLALFAGNGDVETRREAASMQMTAQAPVFPSQEAPSEPRPDAGAALPLGRPSPTAPHAEPKSASTGGTVETFKAHKTSLEDAPDFDPGPLADAGGAKFALEEGPYKPPSMEGNPSLPTSDQLNNASSIESRPLDLPAPAAALASAKPVDVSPAPAQAPAPTTTPLEQADLTRRPTAGRSSAENAPVSPSRYESAGQPRLQAAAGGITGEKFTSLGQGSFFGKEDAARESAPTAAAPPSGGANPGGAGGTEYRYGPHERNVLDFYPGSGKTPPPLIVFFHGGAFYRGDKSDVKDYLSLRNRGYALASCNYRLLKDPSQFSMVALTAYDARNAVRWLKDNATKLRFDPDRVIAVGASAGGYLAAMLGSAGDAALSDEAISETSPAVQVVIDLAGPTDFGGKVIAPLQFVSGNDPPTLIRHGSDDVVVSVQNSLNYAYKLQGANVRVDLKVLDGVGHAPDAALKNQIIKEALDFADTVIKAN